MLRSIPTLLIAMALVAILLPGCVITPDGVQEKEVVVAEIFPPSKSVASYRQLHSPKPIKEDELATQLGADRKLDVLKKWGTSASHVCDYGLPDKTPKVRITVTELPTKFKAYGAYTNLRPGLLPEMQYVKIGVSGTIDDRRLLFIQDRFLIVVLDLGEAPKEQRRALLINFGTRISARIPRAITDIDPVIFLPYADRVTASERLDMEDPLGLDLLTHGSVTALYRREDKECKVFISQLEVGPKSKKSLDDLVGAIKEQGPVKDLSTIGDKGYQGKLLGKDCMVAQRLKIIFGVVGTMPEEQMRQIMVTIDRRVNPFVPKAYKEKAKDSKDDEKAGGLYE